MDDPLGEQSLSRVFDWGLLDIHCTCLVGICLMNFLGHGHFVGLIFHAGAQLLPFVTVVMAFRELSILVLADDMGAIRV